LDSVFAQTFSDYEVIVVNDGSPDDTAQILRPLAEAGKIHYIEQANAGQSSARNRGIREARGEFIAMLDDDDLWPVDKLEWQVAALRAAPDAGLVFGRYQEIGKHPDGVIPASIEDRVYRWEDFLGGNAIQSPGQALMRASVLRGLNGFDSRIWGADDWDLYMRMVGRASLLGSSRLALTYRWHAGNASRNARRMRQNELKVLRRHFLLPGGPGTFSQWRWHRVRYAIHYRKRFAESGDWGLSAYEAIVLRLLAGLSLAGRVVRPVRRLSKRFATGASCRCA
jgi:glycosyltransferase involved in cell wall biosynthesis